MKKKQKNKENIKWIIIISICAFFISLIFSFLSELIIPNVNILLGIILVILFITFGVIFDMIGVAVTAANINTFNSMSSKKVKGGSTGVNLIKKADKVSSFCNDVIGDICGIVSGTAGVIIASKISELLNFNVLIITLITTALIASLTIGGKAYGKFIAINNSDDILYQFAKVISRFYKGTK
ncbi:MAG: hypothetical protein R3Y21_01260 [Mycoplasmatota bacterium]